MPVLKGFDHPARPTCGWRCIVVRASRPRCRRQVQRSDLPEQLTQRLRDLLAYDAFEMQAQAQLAGVEGQSVVYELGPEYKVSFRFGTLSNDQRVKLSNFRISRRVEGRPELDLLQANLTLWADQTTSLGLANSEASPRGADAGADAAAGNAAPPERENREGSEREPCSSSVESERRTAGCSRRSSRPATRPPCAAIWASSATTCSR